MDQNYLTTKCISLFKSFISDLIIVYPEYKSTLYDSYGDILIDESTNIDTFLKNIHKYNTLITNKDDKLFDENIYILDNVSMKDIWKDNITDSTKNSIWKYLQTFCAIYINLKSSENLKELLSGESNTIEQNKKDIQDLKKLQKIKENMKEEDNFENILNNTSIGTLAKEIAESIDMPSMDNISSPDDLSNLLNGDKLMNLFNTVNTKVKEKINTGELNNDILSREAQKLYPNMLPQGLYTI